MDKQVYTEFFNVEHRHWWFLARRDIVMATLRRWVKDLAQKRILDIGCGTGLVMKTLEDRSLTVEGLDMEPAAKMYVQASGVRGMVHLGALPEVELPGTYDLVLLLDVLEHIAEDAASLKKIYALLNPGGMLVMTVPAHPFLWSAYDDYNHHQRRYRFGELRDRLEQNGFKIEHQSYFNAIFFLPIVLFRWFKKRLGFSEAPSDLFVPPSIINRICYRLFRLERHVVSARSFPFGVSMIAVATKSQN